MGKIKVEDGDDPFTIAGAGARLNQQTKKIDGDFDGALAALNNLDLGKFFGQEPTRADLERLAEACKTLPQELTGLHETLDLLNEGLGIKNKKK